MDLLSIAAFFAVAFISAILYLEWKAGHWERRNVFTLQRTGLLGSGLRKNIGVEILELYNEAKSRGLRYAGHYRLLTSRFVPVDLDLIRRILTTDFQHFTDHAREFNEEIDPLSGHLFLLKGAKWKALRVKLTPLFSSGKLKMIFETLKDCSRGLPVILDQAERNGTPIDIKDIFARYTTDVIASIGFGIECNCLKNPDAEFRKIGKLMTQTRTADLLKHIVSTYMPSVYNMLRFTISSKEVEKFIMKIVQDTADYRDENNYRRKDFIQLFLDLRTQVLKVDSTPDENVQDNGSCGFETSSTTLNFLIYELATNLEIQEKLRKEINEVLRKYEGKVTYESVSEMTYLERCVLESVRKYPTIPVLVRECTKRYTVPGTDLVINKGDQIFIPVYGVHRDPDVYPEPEKFDPDRFTEENRNTRPQCTFLGFGDGPRICIGLRLGILQTKVGLISMLRNFRFTLSPKTKTPFEFNPVGFILNVNGGIWINVHRV